MKSNNERSKAMLLFTKAAMYQERSKRNAEDRALQTMNHTAGTKSFARIREEEWARNPDGQAPDRMEMFRLTHTRRDGQLVDWASEDALSQLVAREPREKLCTG
eukprot:TRINITY_DN5673_c1_g1_i10.p1 TRINITY_DN5673_c1_g1~~TRINITY_DN5673_c1_g1_i10.p1  ORF type:complete len:104 (-),score=12.31 TRINITY_DN5673_c1_g1_i10:128-439(-)